VMYDACLGVLACEVQVLGMTWWPMVQGEGQVKGFGVNASRLGPRNPKRPGRVMGDLHGA
jgi:hypothetical protein